MKIRTDFVTNSSSSSYVLEISVDSKGNGHHYIMLNPDDGGGNGEARISCSAEELMNAKSMDDLCELLNGTVSFDREERKFKKKLNEFTQELKSDIQDIEDIKSIYIQNNWFAWGEYASCFAWNYEYIIPELKELAEKVMAGDEQAKEEMKICLNNFNGLIESDMRGSFPSGFMGINNGSIVWDFVADDITEFADKLLNEDLPEEDYSEEYVFIDMENKTIEKSAKYILGKESFL